jgi:hypothetical protein
MWWDNHHVATHQGSFMTGVLKPRNVMGLKTWIVRATVQSQHATGKSFHLLLVSRLQQAGESETLPACVSAGADASWSDNLLQILEMVEGWPLCIEILYCKCPARR